MKRGLFVSFFLTLFCLPIFFSSSAQAFDISPRIFHGNKVTRGEFPGMAALVWRNVPVSYEGQFCAGVLVHRLWVLTAAHCVSRVTSKNTDVVLGRLNLAQRGGERIAVAASFKHPRFQRKSLVYDFALLRLSRSSKSRPLARFFKEKMPPGRILSVAGWGLTEYDSLPVNLLKTRVRAWGQRACRAIYQKELKLSMFCAGAPRRDSCQGDSGGPILLKKKGRLFLAGLVSWGEGCAKPGFPGVYARLRSASSWIERVIIKKIRVVPKKAGQEKFPNPPPEDLGPLEWIDFLGPFDDETYPETHYFSEIQFFEKDNFPIKKIVLSIADAGVVCAPEYYQGCQRRVWTLFRGNLERFSFYTEKKCFPYRAHIFPVSKKLRPFSYKGQSCRSSLS